MQTIPKDTLLEFNPDTLYDVRKLYGLEGEGRMSEAINLLQEWINKQPHFNKKDFSRDFLEVTLITCKGLVEKAKSKLDMYCTYRSLMPKYYEPFYPDNDPNDLLNCVVFALLPKLTIDNHRVLLVQVHNNPKMSSATMMDCFKYLNMISEYIKAHDYMAGMILVIDYINVNILNLVSKFNLLELSQYASIFIEANGMRLNGFHIISTSKTIDVIISLFKKILSKKLSERIKVHKSVDTVFRDVDKNIFPADYGGKEKPYAELSGDLLKAVTSAQHLKYLEMLKEASTNEQFRPTSKLNNDYLGIPGTFRTMVVD